MQLFDLQTEIEYLRKVIREQEALCNQLERECAELRATLDAFEERYKLVVEPIANQLDALKKAIEKLQALQLKQQMGSAEDLDSLLRADRKARTARKDEAPDDQPEELPEELPTAEKAATAKVKALYHRLARLYHPDLAVDEADRAHRNEIMALINRAYSENDLDMLRTLDDASPHNALNPASPQMQRQLAPELALAMLTHQSLQKRSIELDRTIDKLSRERDWMRNGEMMTLNLEAKMAESQGHDYLLEMAEDLQDEYWEYMAKLDAIREAIR